MSEVNILIVDDTELIRRSLQRELSMSGYQVEVAPDGTAALEKVKTNSYDIILLDLMMPGMNGIETCRQMHQMQTGAILILMTGNLDNSVSDVEEEFIRAGGQVYYLYKPFNDGEVIEVIEKALEGRVR